MKISDNARELGKEGLNSLLETKQVHWDLSPEAKDGWYPYEDCRSTQITPSVNINELQIDTKSRIRTASTIVRET